METITAILNTKMISTSASRNEIREKSEKEYDLKNSDRDTLQMVETQINQLLTQVMVKLISKMKSASWDNPTHFIHNKGLQTPARINSILIHLRREIN